MKMIKKLMAVSILAATACLAGAEAFFSGTTGIAGKLTDKDSRGWDPSMTMDGYFSAQFDFNNSFLVRGEFSIQTGDIYSDFFAETDSIFRIDELSCTYMKPLYGVTHFFNLFLGTFEPIGNESFLQHQLGVKKYSSLLTENYLGSNGCNVFDFYGFGAAYSFRLNSLPLSSGLLIYKNNKNENEDAQLNLDWRIGAVLENFRFDCAAGFGAPMNTTNEQGEDVVLLIDTIYLHTGIDILIGNPNTLSLFIQSGFENMPVHSRNKTAKIKADEFYLIAEPRIKAGTESLSVSFFNLPPEKAKKTILLDDSFGFDVCFATERFSTLTRSWNIGLHTTVSYRGMDMLDYDDDDFRQSMKVKVSPFAKFDLIGGKVNTILQVNIHDIKDNEPDAIKLSIGYLKNL